MPDPQRTAQTYRNELWRAIAAGILETAGSTFLLLIAMRWFHAGAISKGLVAGGGSIGLMLSPVVVSMVSRAGVPASLAASRLLAVGAVCFLVIAAVEFLPVYVLGSMIAMATSAAIIPLLTQMYQDNYPERERGRRFARTVMIRIATAAAFSHVAGNALTGHLNYFPVLLVTFAAALGFASVRLARCPTTPLNNDGGAHPLRALRFVREDALFRRTLIVWMLMGFANLMMLPMRVEYLVNPRYGHQMTVGMIALLTGVVPNLARLVMSPVWGHLFDHMNFFALRITLNVGFAVGILTFFMSDTLPGMIAGAVVFGISNSGGDVAWSLWVTKFAPPDRVADYMSVHTFLTGIRGVAAPLVAFALAARYPVGWMAAFSAALIVGATLMLVPEMRTRRGEKQAEALVEEVSE